MYIYTLCFFSYLFFPFSFFLPSNKNIPNIFTSTSQLILYLALMFWGKVIFFLIYSGLSFTNSYIKLNSWNKLNHVCILTFFHSFLYDLETEFKIKWLVKLVVFFSVHFLFFFCLLVDKLLLHNQPSPSYAIVFTRLTVYIYTRKKRQTFFLQQF